MHLFLASLWYLPTLTNFITQIYLIIQSYICQPHLTPHTLQFADKFCTCKPRDWAFNQVLADQYDLLWNEMLGSPDQCIISVPLKRQAANF